jgi:25S rRNA (uracil2843-N3)-methyltransferase
MGQFDRKAQSQPKHGKPSSSGASKAPLRPNNGTPEWKGPGYIPKKKSTAGPTPSPAQEPSKLEPTLPLELEQRMLEVFRATFPASSDFEALKPILYKVNDALLRRDLDAAFADEEHLEAYAIRWSPSRALGYAQLLAWICAERADDACIQHLVGSSVSTQGPSKAVCFGGGAAEIMAFSGLLRHSRPSEAAGKPSTPATTEVSDSLEALKISATTTTIPTTPLLHLSHLDIANWASVLSKLEQGLNTPPALSKYASATARATNASFLSPGAVEHSFTKRPSPPDPSINSKRPLHDLNAPHHGFPQKVNRSRPSRQSATRGRRPGSPHGDHSEQCGGRGGEEEVSDELAVGFRSGAETFDEEDCRPESW